MSAERMMKTPCTLLLRQEEEEDALGNPVLGEPVEVETTCALQQRRRDEPTGEGETSVTEWDLFLPHGTEINTGDAVRVKGRVYELVGDPWDADEGSRAMWHVAATVKRVAGAGGEVGS
jgi:hypothetical protein